MTKEWVLASASPRRQSLMRLFGQPFRAHPAHIDETLPETTRQPSRWGKALAHGKAEAIAPHYSNALIFAADTLVVLGGTLLAKPEDEAHAKAMLRALSGRTHLVITAVCILEREGGETTRLALFAPQTKVTFRALSASMIEWYVKTGEPMDKAGAYGIQEYGALLVEKVCGCYFNVVGFPLVDIAKQLEAWGYPAYSTD